MSDQQNSFPFVPMDGQEEAFDIDDIFGGADNPDGEASGEPILPFGAEAEADAPAPEPPAVLTPPKTVTPATKPTQPSPKAEAPAGNLIEAAFATQETKEAEEAAESLFEKLPIFAFGGAKEKIEDASMTFEELRIAKSEDYPELGDGKKVSWTVTYGKITKTISEPAAASIGSIKSEIETSKAFLDSLKKATDKTPDCVATPKVAFQSKGIASYKGVFGTLEAAQESDKAICLIPAQDGKVYELRKSELGEFIAPKTNIVEFASVRAGFTPALPRIPNDLLWQVITFFRSFLTENDALEAMVHLYWDKENEEFFAHVPKQTVTHMSIHADLVDDEFSEERYLHYADIHSHNTMEAHFSAVDDADERATRLYIVIGHLERYLPEASVRVSCGGSYLHIDPALVLEPHTVGFPAHWRDNVASEPHTIKAPCFVSMPFVPGVSE